MVRGNSFKRALIGISISIPVSLFAEGLEFHGAGWSQIGRMEESFAPQNSENDYNKNWLGSSGGQINAIHKIDENWDLGMGLGTALVNLARGSRGSANIWYPFWVPFISESRLTYSGSNFDESGGLQASFGYFPYNYNPDIKNLGAYLLRGYVYPGTLISGSAFQGAPLADFGKIFGTMIRFQKAGFRNDFILNSETENKPLFDYSIADVVSYQPHPSIEIGAGINFYRLIPQSDRATNPGKDCRDLSYGPRSDLGPYSDKGNGSGCFIVRVDSAGNPKDTVTGSLAGTKVMGRFRLDPKAWFGEPERLGKNDLVIYGEAAIIGLKDYPVYYDDILRRIPVMIGLNLPGFGYFDWSFEVEYYANKNSNDDIMPQNGSWLPAVDDQVSTARDDWKWSFNASKVLFGHMLVAVQAANDHLRLGGFHDKATGVEALRTPKDWYWSGKLAYFF